ncbi:MAG TPA: hypothetical protein VFK41_06335 [Nocardioidaceae bacterium]|nr:hypothetical protein [Nocardioidaceae bacterium]
MAGFIQIIVFESSKIDEIRALAEDYRAANPGNVNRASFTADRDNPNTYCNIVEFESYEAAMENSNRPETSEFAGKLAALCDGPPKFYNLDVMETYN